MDSEIVSHEPHLVSTSSDEDVLVVRSEGDAVDLGLMGLDASSRLHRAR